MMIKSINMISNKMCFILFDKSRKILFFFPFFTFQK